MRSRTPDRLCAEAVDVALAVTEEAAGPQSVGEHLGVVAEGDRVVTHYFACKEPAYRGWRWATTLTRASRAKNVTVDETVLLPGPDAVLAPEWVPWSERLRPGDMGPGDLLPTEADDLRLEPGWTGEGAVPGPEVEEALGVPAGGEHEAGGAGAGAQVGAGGVGRVGVGGIGGRVEVSGVGLGVDEEAEVEVVSLAEPPSIAKIGSVAEEIGMGRARVLSRHGLHTAADRWDERFGAKTPMAQAAPAHCVSCGFLVPIAGSLGQAFGVCANEFSPADGHMVSLAYGCGGHSEAAVMPRPPHPAPMVLDDLHDTEALPLHAEGGAPEGETERDAEADVGPGPDSGPDEGEPGQG